MAADATASGIRRPSSRLRPAAARLRTPAAEADTQLTLTLQDTVPEDWEPEGDEVAMSAGSLIDGRWWTDQHLVREMPDEIVAYDRTTGEVAWRVPVEGSGSCRSSQEVTPAGYVAVLRGDGMGSKAEKGCHQLTVVDIAKGKEVWTVELEKMKPTAKTVGGISVIAGGYVHVVTGRGGAHHAIADGSPAEMTLVGNCEPLAYQAIQETLISWMQCVNDDREPFRAMLGWEGEMRQIAWGGRHPTGEKDPVVARVLSLDPLLVVSDTRTAQEIWRVLRRRFDENGRRNGVVAVDTETGDQRWTASADGEATLCLVDLDENGGPLLYQPQTDDSPAVVLTADPKTGDLTALAGLPWRSPPTRASTCSGTATSAPPPSAGTRARWVC